MTTPDPAPQRPDLPLTGGCQCHACRYEITGWPVTFYLCHCSECQAQSGSAFGESLQVRGEDLSLTGPTGTWVRPTASGSTIEATFCTVCGSRLVHRRAASPDVANVRAGTLDDRSWLAPIAHIWAGSRQPWVDLGNIRAFEAGGDAAEMQALWRGMWG